MTFEPAISAMAKRLCVAGTARGIALRSDILTDSSALLLIINSLIAGTMFQDGRIQGRRILADGDFEIFDCPSSEAFIDFAASDEMREAARRWMDACHYAESFPCRAVMDITPPSSSGTRSFIALSRDGVVGTKVDAPRSKSYSWYHPVAGNRVEWKHCRESQRGGGWKALATHISRLNLAIHPNMSGHEKVATFSAVSEFCRRVARLRVAGPIDLSMFPFPECPA